MIPSFIAFMLAGTLFLSWNDIQRKRLLNAEIDERHLLVASFILGGLILCVPLVYFGIPRILPAFWIAAIATTCVGVVSQQWYFRAFKLSDASLVAPLRLITPPLVIITGFVLLGEQPTFLGACGIFVTVAGLWFLLFPTMRPSWKLERGTLYGLGACALFAVSFPLDKLAVVSSSALFAGATVFPAIGLLIFLQYQISDRTFASRLVAAIGRAPGDFIAFSSTFALGLFFSNQALNYSLTAYAASLKRLQAVWTVIFSGGFLHEKDIARRFVAVLIMFVGIILSVVFQ